MFNAIRMDIYRLFHTKAAYVILAVMVVLTIMAGLLTSVLMDEQSVSEGQVSVEYAGEEELMQPPTVAQALADEISSNLFNMLLAIFAAIFATADINSGYLKSIGGQVKRRGILLFSKSIALALFLIVAVLLEFVVQFLCTNIFYDGVVFGNLPELLRFLGVQMLLNYALMLVVMGFSVMIKNNVINMILVVGMTTGIFSVFYGGINLLLDRIGVHDFYVQKYMITEKLPTVVLGVDSKTVTSALLVAAVWAVVFVVAAGNVFKHRDI